MRYRRRGVGSVTVVLLGLQSTDAAITPIADALAAGARLVEPELGADEPEAVLRLLAFLEGLGATQVAVVASDPFCDAAVELALMDGGPLTSVVLLRGDRGDGPDLDGAPTSAGRPFATPVLVVRGWADGGDAASRIAQFVRGGGRPGGG